MTNQQAEHYIRVLQNLFNTQPELPLAFATDYELLAQSESERSDD